MRTLTSKHTITLGEVRSWLHAVQFNKMIPTSIQPFVPSLKTPSNNKYLNNYIAIEWLTYHIQNGYNYHRQSHNLHCICQQPNLSEAKNNIKIDFSQQNKYLESWSLLYYLYACVDLCLASHELEEITMQSGRNLRRRKKLAIQMVYHKILEN